MDNYTIPVLGLYGDTIKIKLKECYDIINGAKSIADKYDAESYQCMCIDIDSKAKNIMAENFDFENMTDSIISAYQQSTVSALNACPLFEKLHIKFDNYVNCDDSHINMCVHNTERDVEQTITICDEEDIYDGIINTLCEQIHNAIMLEFNIDYTADDLAFDLEMDNITENDIDKFLNQNILSENIKRLISELIEETNTQT